MAAELVTTAIANRLSKRREELRVTQSEIARALKTSQTTVQKILMGEARKSDHVRPMWTYLGLPMDELEGLIQGSQPKHTPVHPLAAAKHDIIEKHIEDHALHFAGHGMATVDAFAEHPPSDEVTLVIKQRVRRMFGVSFGWTQPKSGGAERVMVVHHADGTSITYVVEPGLCAQIARAMARDDDLPP